MFKDKKSTFALFLIAYIVVWNLINYTMYKDTAQFSLYHDTIIPIVTALVLGYFFILRKQ